VPLGTLEQRVRLHSGSEPLRRHSLT
jgi:hypothetical protein